MLGQVPPHQQGQAPPPPLNLDSINDGDTIDMDDSQPHQPDGPDQGEARADQHQDAGRDFQEVTQ